MKAVLVGIIAALGFAVGAPDPVMGIAKVVISQVQAGGAGAAQQEIMTLYNSGDQEADITGWCLTNKTSTTTSFKAIACFESQTIDERTILPPAASAVIVSSPFLAAYPVFKGPPPRVYDIVIETVSGVLTGTSDTLSLYDAERLKVDEVQWTNLEGGKHLRRLANPDDSTQLLDTDTLSDFTKESVLLIPQSGVEYVRYVVDRCGNIEDVQEVVPPDFGYDEAGNCEPLSADRCSNLLAVQLAVPAGLMADETGGCYADHCDNIIGLQKEIPEGYRVAATECVALEHRPIIVNELLANAVGSDAGHEFVELYNPHDEPINLDGYVLRVGKNLDTVIELSGSIASFGYLVIDDTQLGVSLLNTVNRISVTAPAGNLVHETSYVDAPEGESWALLDDEWRYTNQPTPGSKNLPSLLEGEVAGVSSALAPCVVGKYRHPITNRCRNIETDTTILATCGADEYRNPDTNRCRKVASLASSLTPCNAGYERNPSTNRCRKLSSVAVTNLTPCKQGYERNPDTNRCRKVAAMVPQLSTGASTERVEPPGSVMQTALVAAAGLSAVGYGIYEWRNELGRGLRRLLRTAAGK